jgi:hypothetical protein
MNTDGLDRERLAKLLGMLGSDHLGEVAAAARQAERLRRKAGLTWPEILTSASPPALLQVTVPNRPRSVEEAINLCIDHRVLLSDWERRFVASISQRPVRRLSKKQLDVLDRLVRAILAQLGTP